MTPPSSWPDAAMPIILDASAVINLNGSGAATEILSALRRDFIVAQDVYDELKRGASNGRRDFEALENLIGQDVVRRQDISALGIDLFESLTIGPSAMTLDDGEAATIALAFELSGVVVIDEDKGRRLAQQTAAGVPLLSSVELFCNPIVERALASNLADAVFSALQQSRMQVLSSHHAWIIKLLGPERASLCRSLPRSVRQP
jgi:predicted nucleic acid-binding protein